MSTVVTIKYFTGSLAGRSQPLVLNEGQRVRMGRAQDSDIRFIDAIDDSVSSLHAELSLQQGRVYLEDKRSTNGTFVNGERCVPFQAIALADGSRIRLGKEGPEMQLLVEAPAAAAAGVAARSVDPAAPAASAGAAPGGATLAGTAATDAGSGLVPAKVSVGRATLLREIDRARQDERNVVSGQLANSRRNTGVWVALGLVFVLVLAALGIGGVVLWNRRQLEAQRATTSAEVAKAETDAARAASLAKENVWASVERHAGPAVVHIRCGFRVFRPRIAHKLTSATAQLVETRGEFYQEEAVEGSGVLVKPGLVLTARHLIEPWQFEFKPWSDLERRGWKAEDQMLEVQFPGQQPIKASLVAASDKFDLALLQIQPTNAPYVAIAKSNEGVKVTDRIAVIGYPADVGQTTRPVAKPTGAGSEPAEVTDITPTFVVGTITQGIHSALDYQKITFDASITNGNSGGAVLNERGELIGIVTAQYIMDKKKVIMGVTVWMQDPVPGANVAVSPQAIQEFLRTYGMT